MAAESFTMTLEGHHTTLSPDQIERELSSMWKPMEEGTESTSVTRVVLGNVIWIGLADQVERVRAIVQKVVPKYPCRLFLLQYERENTSDEVKASVSAQCFVPQKGEPPVCCEVIGMSFGPNAARHLRGCVAPLLLPDIQTVLWENLGGVFIEQFDDLQKFADRTITQVSLTRNPARILRRLGEGATTILDLSWFRLGPIRDQVAAFFDDTGVTFDLNNIAVVKVQILRRDQNRALPEVMAALFAGWMGSLLGWKPVGPTNKGFRFDSPSGPVEVTTERVAPTEGPVLNNMNEIRLTDRKGEVFNLTMQQCGGAMDLWCGERDRHAGERHLVLSELSEADALGAALNMPASFERFRAAALLAVPLLDSFYEAEES